MAPAKFTSADQVAIVERMAAMTGSASAKFFGAQGFHAEYDRPGKYASKESRIVSALGAANSAGRLSEVLAAATAFLAASATEIGAGANATGRSTEGPTPGMSDRVIFVSHAHSERDVAHLFQQTLNLAGVVNSKLFLSSSRSTGVPTGRDVLPELRDRLNHAELIIELVSNVFLTRPMCMMEFGAAWAMGKQTFPVVLPPLTRDEASRQLGNVQMHQLLGADDVEFMLDDLHGAVERAAGLSIGQPDWSSAAKYFRANLTAARASTPPAPTGTVASVFAPSRRPRSSGRPASKPRPQTRLTGPATRTVSVDAKNELVLDKVTDALRNALRPLDRGTRRVVLHWTTWGASYRPDEGHEMANAEKIREVEQDYDGDWVPRESNRAVGRACEAARVWRDALEIASEDEAESFMDEYELNEVDSMSYDLWEKLSLI